MFQRILMAFEDPILVAQIRNTGVVLLLIILIATGVYYIQNQTGNAPADGQSDVQFLDHGNERVMLESALRNGDLDSLFAIAIDKKINWNESFAERIQNVGDRISVAQRILELPAEPHQIRVAKIASLRALIDRETVFRYNDIVDTSQTRELVEHARSFDDQDDQDLHAIATAAHSVVAMGRLLDADLQVDSEELFQETASLLDTAAELNCADNDIALTHFFWIDWIRSKFGDKRSKPLIDALSRSYSDSKLASIRENMKRVLRSYEESNTFLNSSGKGS